MSSAVDGQTLPIDAEIRELHALGLIRFDEACFRCVKAATHLRYHVRSGWLPVCSEHKSPPVAEPQGRRRK